MQRVEVITGRERRRRWSEAEKIQLVAESHEPGAVISQIARRHGVAESCIYTWRKQIGSMLPAPAPRLIPVSIDAPVAPEPACPPVPTLPPHALITFPDGTRVEIGADYPTRALKTLIATVAGRR